MTRDLNVAFTHRIMWRPRRQGTRGGALRGNSGVPYCRKTFLLEDISGVDRMSNGERVVASGELAATAEMT